jgi:multiple sugar transport system substrate-binding protein
VALILTTGNGCGLKDLSAKKALEEQVALEIWGVFDSSEAFTDLINDYRSKRINVSIKYRKLQFAEYEQALSDAIWEGRGPDIIMVHNTWVGGYVDKLTPAPEEIKVVAANITGGYNKKVEPYFINYPSASDSSIRSDFVSVVAQDAIRGGQVYGLPLSVDTLALYYNRALLDQAGVAAVPRTWQEIKEASQSMTLYDEEGTVVRSGIALGGAYNINRSFDILSLLMAQNGTAFLNPDG